MSYEGLPPPAEDKKAEEWERYNTLYPSAIRDAMMFRWGYIPIFYYRQQQNMPERRSATLAPSNKYYSMYETAKRNKVHYMEKARQKQIRDTYQTPREILQWRPPIAVTRMPPNGILNRDMQTFNKPLRQFRMRRGMF